MYIKLIKYLIHKTLFLIKIDLQRYNYLPGFSVRKLSGEYGDVSLFI